MAARERNAYINAEVINDRAKLLTHRLIARELARNPDLIGRARERLAHLREEGRNHDHIVEWEHLLDLGVEKVRRLITERSETMYRLRISSPLGLSSGLFVDNEDLRRRIRQKAKLGLMLQAQKLEWISNG